MTNRTMAVVTAIIYKDESGVSGFVEEIPTVRANGKSENEVRKRLRKAVQAYYEENHENIAQRMETYTSVRRERLAVEVDLPSIELA
jgi:predicted RNase H-like HicB family nuclease